MLEAYRAIGAACVVILLTWAWQAVNWAWFKPRKLERLLREQGLIGNSYRFLYGDIKESSRMRAEEREKPIPFSNHYFPRVLPFLHQHISKYGKNCFTWMGPVPVINIADPELIRDALTRIEAFRKPRLNPLLSLLAPGLVSYEGEQWTKHRRLINPAFHVQKLKLLVPAFCTSIHDTIEKWEKYVSEKGFSEIDVWPYLTNLSADAISRAAFGSSYEEGKRIFVLLKEQTELTMQLFQSVYLPGWRFIPTKTNKRMKEINAEIEASLTNIIEKRKKASEAGEPAKDDLLGVLLESSFKNSESQATEKEHLTMTFKEVIDECKLFYFAGQETTSVLLVWTIILLGKHTEWQTRAREEVLATFGMNQPDFDGLSQLKTVNMILYEVLRLYPPVVALSRRIFSRETKLGGLYVPPGAMVSLSIIQVHQDATLWGDDAKEFKPERFSEGTAKATRGNISFFPFGWGPRICIGQNFAMVEAKMALAMILQHFSFELSPSYIHGPTTIITLQPQFGAPVILHRLQ